MEAKSIENIEQRLVELSFEFMVAARFAIMNEQIEKANSLFLKSLRANHNPMNVRSFADFLFERGCTDKAVYYYNMVLSMEDGLTEKEKAVYDKDIQATKEFLVVHKP